MLYVLMEKLAAKNHVNGSQRHRERVSGGVLSRASPTTSDFVLRWGNRKRLRCVKIQAKDEPSSIPKTTVRVDRRVVGATLKEASNRSATMMNGRSNHGYINLRQRTPSPSQRVLRKTSEAMKGQSNGLKGISSPDGCASTSMEAIQDAKKGSPSRNETLPATWPPKFVLALTNKEKEEDFMAIKGSKLPQRPKKRAKVVQRFLNLVSPGGWLCDLTLDRYEVRERKTSKKLLQKPRGLKAMGNLDSDSD